MGPEKGPIGGDVQPDRGGSERLATGRDRPDCFDLAVPHADIPIMHIGRGIAVTGHKVQLVADLVLADHADEAVKPA